MSPGSLGRSNLLRATITVGLAQGLSGVTSRSVAEEAGVAHSLVRYHFGSIDALVTEALGLAIDEGVATGKRLTSTTTFAEFTADLAESITTHRDTHAFLYEALLESRRRPELFPQVERYFRDYRRAISEQLRRLGATDPSLIDVVYFAIEGITFKEVAYPDQLGSRAAIVRLQRLLADSAGIELAEAWGEGDADEVSSASGSGASADAGTAN